MFTCTVLLSFSFVDWDKLPFLQISGYSCKLMLESTQVLVRSASYIVPTLFKPMAGSLMATNVALCHQVEVGGYLRKSLVL
jgi:hypothetical protein